MQPVSGPAIGGSDIYREAAKRSIDVQQVKVEVAGTSIRPWVLSESNRLRQLSQLDSVAGGSAEVHGLAQWYTAAVIHGGRT
jgi:hypothetical protein